MIAYLEAPATQIGGCSFVNAAQRLRNDSGIRFGRGRYIPSAFLENAPRANFESCIAG
jgi:hypothetical protein